MFLGEGFEPDKITPREWISLFFFPFGVILGMILAWWKEGLGGAITVASLIGEILVGDVSGAGGRYMLICASPGFLFLILWLLSQTAETVHIPVEEDISEPSVALAPEPEVLDSRRARIAAGLCPKCGAQLKPADQNCLSCRVNLAFARAHLDQW